MKPIAAVMLEGTMTDGGDPDVFDFGEWKPGVITKLDKLRETHYVLIVSSNIRHPLGCRALLDRLIRESIPFDEIWLGEGVPACDVRYDDSAKRLGDAFEKVN